MEKKLSDLEAYTDFERAEWPVLRIGWLAMGLFLLAGVLGLFGTGLFTERTEGDATLSVRYERYLRYSMSSEINIHTSGLARDSSLWINSDYLKKAMITSVNPEPESMDQLDGMLRLKFASRFPSDITIYLQPEDWGRQELTIRLNGRKKTIKQFIYF